MAKQEIKTINFYSFTSKVRKTKNTQIINGIEYDLWKSIKNGSYNDFIEVEDGKFAMVWHDPCGWHVSEAYPVVA